MLPRYFLDFHLFAPAIAYSDYPSLHLDFLPV